MGNRNIAEERPAAPATGKNTSPSEAVAQNTTTATNTAKTAEDAELRKKVEARTEYLNSIKLLLS